MQCSYAAATSCVGPLTSDDVQSYAATPAAGAGSVGRQNPCAAAATPGAFMPSKGDQDNSIVACLELCRDKSIG